MIRFARKKRIRMSCHRMFGSEGMITLEVSVIIPILLLVIGGIVFFHFFLIDMAAAKSEALRIATEAGAAWKTEGDLATKTYISGRLLARDPDYLKKDGDVICRKAVRRLRSRMAYRKILRGSRSCQVTMDRGIVRVRQEIGFSLPIRGMSTYLGSGRWVFTCKASAVSDIWEEEFRKCASGSITVRARDD